MPAVNPSLVHDVRRFNRFYTNILGLLDKSMLKSGYSLPEARLLYELYHNGGQSASQLTGELTIDPGYFSRLFKHLETRGLVRREKSPEDGRAYLLYLTDKGKETFLHLDQLSQRQISGLTEKLPENRQALLTQGIAAVEEALNGDAMPKKDRVAIRQGLEPGDAGRLISLHGWIYRQECGYDFGFESYVCKTFYEFLGRYREDKDRIWFAEDLGQMVGAIAVVGHTAERAQLRWFILHPEYRGIGLGKRLMGEAMAYVKEKGFREVFLLTTKDQQTAIGMYEKAGFQKASEQESRMWGKDLTELTYEWHKA